MKKIQIISVLVILMVSTLFNSAPVSALNTNWYVTTSGSNSNDCLSWETACGTIQGAVDKAGDGDTVNIGAGTYYENVTLNKDVDLTGAGMYATIVDASGVAKPLLILEGVQAVVQKMAFTDSGYDYTDNMGNGGIFIKGGGSDVTISQNRIYANAGPGIISFGAHHIINNLIENNGTNGVFREGIFLSTDSTAVIENNTIIDNTQVPKFGIYAHPDAISATIKNNIIAGFNVGIYISDAGPSAMAGYNDFWNNSTNYYNLAAGVGDIYSDPWFADPSNGNYHLNQCSPAVDAGDPTSDYSAEPMPNGGRINLGVYGNTPEAELSRFSQQECAALVALYNSTNGAGWTNNTNWLKSDSPCSWHGIYCWEDVYEISLGSNNLTGSIPPQIGDLTNLQSLALNENNLSGSIPSQVGNLLNLKGLYLYNNNLSGGIPPEINNLAQLEHLSISDNQLSGPIPPGLGNLSNLKSLGLNLNSFSGDIPVEIWNLTNLEGIYLWSNQLTGTIPAEIGNLTNLHSIALGGNQLSGNIPPELGNLSQLYSLQIQFNNFTGPIPPELGNLTNLTSLFLGWNQLSGSIPSELGNLTNLTRLSLEQNQLSGTIPPELGNLARLEWLYLNNNQLSGSIPVELGSLSNLDSLRLHYNQLSGSIPAELGNLAKLDYMYLNNNSLDGSIPPQLGNLPELRYLYLDNNLLSGPIPSEIGNLPALVSLSLRSNQLTGAIPVELGNLPALKYLYLQYNQLNGPIPAEIGKLTGLISLYLHGNQLSGTIPSEIGNLALLRNLMLSYNSLSGSIPATFGNLGALVYLDLGANQLTGSIPAEVGNLTALQVLDLYDNQLNGAIPPTIGNLTSLERIELETNQISGPIPPEIGNLTGLINLQLNDNQLSGQLPAEIGNLTSLQWLRLQNNQLQGEFPTTITNLVELQEFTFDCTLTSTNPAVIAFLMEKAPITWANCTNTDPSSPVVLSITRSNPSPTSAASVNFAVVFSEAVTGVNIGDFSIYKTGVTGTSITNTSGSGTTYTVTVNTGSGDGTIRLDVVDNNSIVDSENNPLGGDAIGDGNFTSGEIYTILKSKPGIPVLLSPANGGLASTLQPTLDWKDSTPLLDHYQLQVARNNTFTDLVVDEADLTTSEFTFISNLDPGRRYFWRVRAFNILDQTKGWSTPWNFRTPLDAPTLGTPACGASLLTDRPAFDWLDVEGAASYTIQVSPTTSFGTLLLNAVVTPSNYQITKDLPQNKILYWRVKAQTPVVSSPWSLKCSFTTGNPPTVPVLASPANNALLKDYTPTLKWYKSAIPSGTTFKRYELQLDNNNDFSSPEIEFSTSDGVLSETTFTPPSDLAPNMKYYWRVRAVNLVGADEHASSWSAVRSFRTVMLPPTLLLPADGSTVGTLKPFFDWDDVEGAASYTIQISTSASFGTYLVNTKVTSSNFTPSTNLPKNKVIYWRVRANGPNGPSAWSVFQFVTPP